jgi:peptidoglycan L-alanyl-D-glutamate endopeptidase CwlK
MPPATLTKRTVENLAGLNAHARERIEELMEQAQPILAAAGVRLEVISGLRSWQQQAALYARGRTQPGRKVTNAPPGSSWHNYGLAVDFGIFRGATYLDEAEPRTTDRLYREIAVVARNLGIEWAGDWRTFQETPHFQYRPGIASIREAKDRFQFRGMSVARMLP